MTVLAYRLPAQMKRVTAKLRSRCLHCIAYRQPPKSLRHRHDCDDMRPLNASDDWSPTTTQTQIIQTSKICHLICLSTIKSCSILSLIIWLIVTSLVTLPVRPAHKNAEHFEDYVKDWFPFNEDSSLQITSFDLQWPFWTTLILWIQIPGFEWWRYFTKWWLEIPKTQQDCDLVCWEFFEPMHFQYNTDCVN